MPPPGAPQPPQKNVDSFVVWMESTLDSHPKGPRAGHVPIQRLNRIEYAASVKALLDGGPCESFTCQTFILSQRREGTGSQSLFLWLPKKKSLVRIIDSPDGFDLRSVSLIPGLAVGAEEADFAQAAS